MSLHVFIPSKDTVGREEMPIFMAVSGWILVKVLQNLPLHTVEEGSTKPNAHTRKIMM